MPQRNLPVALTIATSDSGCGAGAQADLLTFSRAPVFGLTALAALTAQNPDGVAAIHEVPAHFLRAQLDQLARYFPITGIKTGMLFSAELIETAAAFLRQHEAPAVVDPVMIATSGACLLQEDAVHSMRTRLFPAATLITPNLDEASSLLGRPLKNTQDMNEAAHELAGEAQTAVLLKGGHLEGDELVDILAFRNGKTVALKSRRIQAVNTHGSGCTLSAAIAAQLAGGADLESAVRAGHRYLRRCLQTPLQVAGVRFINHR